MSAESPIEQARTAIIAASLGSCSCDTKSPEVAFHAGHCRYAKLMFAMDCLDGLAQTLPRQPTEAMLNAARDWSREKYGKPIGNDAATGCWLAMHAAALLDTSTVNPTQTPWECMGLKQALPEPGECNWPDCGCDPHATAVIESLIEQGWSPPALSHSSTDRHCEFCHVPMAAADCCDSEFESKGCPHSSPEGNNK